MSKSPLRHTFQRDLAFKEEMNGGTIVTDEALDAYDYYDHWRIEDEETEQDPRFAENNLEYDLRTTDWILAKVRGSDYYAQNLYAALCNNEFRRNDVWPILTNDAWHCSWRFAGGIIADMKQQGDYIDWYCSGIRDPDDSGDPDPIEDTGRRFVSESMVTDEIREDLFKLGWIVVVNGD